MKLTRESFVQHYLSSTRMTGQDVSGETVEGEIYDWDPSVEFNLSGSVKLLAGCEVGIEVRTVTFDSLSVA